MYMRDGLQLSGKDATVFANELSAAVDSGMDNIKNMLYVLYVAGYRCQENIDDCLQPDGQMPCSGHGLCIDALNSYSCLCEPGWKGAQCDHPIDECPFHQCQNNATCVNTNEGYDCLCAPGYTGAFCGALVDECTLLGACLNGARCVDLFNDYR